MSKAAIGFGVGTVLVGACLSYFLGPVSALIGLVVGVAFMVYGIRGYSEEKADTAFFSDLLRIRENPTPPAVPQIEQPSFLFVFGAPLGANDSSKWIMLFKHYGPNPAHNCDIGFYDKDRKNIEHLWLVEHPNVPYPPANLAGTSQLHRHIDEANPEGSAGSFEWIPLNPNSQHYAVSISCRDGVFEETWEITRVNGVLRTRIEIKRGPQWIKEHPNSNPIVFTCTDPEFSPTALASVVPVVTAPVVHPGWKPNYPVQVPMAIIDPNGNVQIASGIGTDKGQKTDFGCWRLLTSHLQ